MQSQVNRLFVPSVICGAFLVIGFLQYQAQAHEGDPGGGDGKTVVSQDGNFSKVIPGQAESPQTRQPAHHIGDKAVPPGTIIVDGNPQDWFDAGIPTLVTDPPGDFAPPGLDMLSLRVTDDSVNVYFLYEFAAPPVDCSFLLLDTDTNPATGCNAGGIGIEYGVTFCPSSEFFFIGDAQDCSWGGGDFPGALITAVGGNYIEASVPISILQIITPTLTAFDIVTGNDNSSVARYMLGPGSPTVDITAVPNPTMVGGPLDILLDLNNPGDGFDAEFRLWVLASGNVTTLVDISPFVGAGLVLTEVNIFSTASVPAGLPPVVGFLAAIFNAASGELLDWDFESVGIGVALTAADITALRQTATDFLNSGNVNAAPPRPEEELNFNGTAKNPFGQRVNTKGKLTTTWGRIKSQR